jgi:hypothetical protein
MSVASQHVDVHRGQGTARVRPIDHDWMFDDPELFVQQLDALGLRALPLA